MGLLLKRPYVVPALTNASGRLRPNAIIHPGLSHSAGSARVAYAQQVLADSPAAYYRLGEANTAAGQTALDSSGNANNGTYAGTVTGSQTGALSGDTNTAVLGSATAGVTLPALGITGDATFSLECWVNIPDTVTGYYIMQLGAGGGAGDTALLGVNVRGAGVLSVEFNGGNPATAVSAITAGVYHHIVVVKTPGVIKSTTTIYADNVSLGVTAGSSGITPNLLNNASALLGQGGGNFPGTLDEAAFYTTALSATRVAAHYNTGLGL